MNNCNLKGVSLGTLMVDEAEINEYVVGVFAIIIFILTMILIYKIRLRLK